MSTFAQRMQRIIGDQNTAARYLLEKVGHTALITLVVHTALPLELSAEVAMATYLVLDKVVVRIESHDWATFWRTRAFWRRLVFIGVTIALVPVLTLAERHDIRLLTLALAAWAVVWLVLEHFGWEEAPV
jgi:hypothetical protein